MIKKNDQYVCDECKNAYSEQFSYNEQHLYVEWTEYRNDKED